MMNNCTNNFIKRVIGVTRTFKWTITTNGAAVPLVAEDLTLQLVPPRGEAVSLPFDVDDNVVSFTWQGDDQHIIGCYSLILWANYGEDNQRRVDIHNFVELIPWSDRQSGEYSDLVEETIELETADFGENIMVVDNLNSTSATDALSANMGRQLNVTKQDVIADLATIRSGAAAGAAVKEWAKNDPLITDDATQVSASKLAFNGNLFEQWVPGIASSIGLKGIAGFLKLADISQWDSAYNDRMLPTVAAVKAKLQAVLTALGTIEAVIPSQASSSNKLTDKDYVDGAIATNTANFVGTFDSLAELQAVQNPTKNDYGFVIESDAQGNEYYDRYKYTGTQWLFEYKVESTPFTAEQWAAIQSGITAALVSKLSALPTNAELNTALASKQPVINDLTTIRSGAAAGATAYQKPAAGIPKTDLASGVQASLNKADEALSRNDMATVNGSDLTHGGNVTIVAAEGQTITIDAAPTAGSSNAVSSGGVYNATSAINKSVSAQERLTSIINNFNDGVVDDVILYNGSTGATAGCFVTPYLDIQSILSHQWKWYQGSDRSSYSGNIASLRIEYFNENKQYINYASYTADPRTITNSSAVANAKYIRITFVRNTDCYLLDITDNEYIWFGYYIGKKVIMSAIDSKVDELQYQTTDYIVRGLEEYFDMTAYATWTSGYLDANGNHGSSSVNKHTDYIYIRGMRKLRTIMNTTINPTTGNLCFYDINKTFISGFNPHAAGSKGYEEKIVEVPANAAYLRTTIYTEYISNWFLQGFNEGSIFNRLEGNGMPQSDAFYLTTLIQSKRPQRNVAGTTAGNILSLLHFSDIHGQQTPLDTIIAFKKKYGAYIDDTLCTGDLVNDHFGQTNIFEDTDGAESILMTIGNHDVCLGNSVSPMDYVPYSGVTTLQAYNEYIAPFVSNWGVVQPTNAATLGLNYYYKDYDNIRLIVLDCYEPNGSTYIVDQISWFSNVLASARTSGKSVVAAVHMTAAPMDYERETGFCSYERTVSSFIDGGFASAVQSFINLGGDFVCWLAGHTHYDIFGTLRDYPSQTQLTITCAYHDQYDDGRVVDTPTANSFNIVSFDTHSKIIKVMRVGNNEDLWLRPKNVLTWDYANKKIVTTY